MKHIYLFIGAAIITYLLISLATLDLMWYVHNTPWIWIAVIPLFLFLYFFVFMCFHEEMGFREDRAMQQTLAVAKANKLIEKLQEQLPNMFQGLVDMSMAEWKSHTNLTHPGKYFRPSKVKIMRPTSPK